ncbi:MAG: hypothetical protein ACT4QB_23575 [Gammaproteobacteria bacterium]
MATRTLTLIVPGLSDAGRAEEKPPALERLLARSDPCAVPVVPQDFYEATLCALFGLRAEPGRDLPIAALTHLVDFDVDHDGCWMRADPVYLRADLGRLRLFDGEGLLLARDEASGLAAEVAGVLAEHGFALHIGRDSRRWYLLLPNVPDIVTRPPAAVLGDHIDPYLPSGPERRFWHRLANDVQMVLHGAAINAAREGRGEPPINSLWFWGAGTMPVRTPVPWARVLADDALGLGLARHGDIAHGPVPRGAFDLWTPGEIEGDVLVVLRPGARAKPEPTADPYDPLHRIEEQWFAPLLAMLQRRRLARLTVYTDARCFTITRAGAWRVWRRAGPLPSASGRLT